MKSLEYIKQGMAIGGTEGTQTELVRNIEVSEHMHEHQKSPKHSNLCILSH